MNKTMPTLSQQMVRTLPFSQPKRTDIAEYLKHDSDQESYHADQWARYDQHGRTREVPRSQPSLSIDDAPVARLYAGIEFEGMIRAEVYNTFTDAMYELGGYDDEGNPLIQFGHDGSVKNIPAGFQSVEIRTSKFKLRSMVKLFEEMLCFLYLASEIGDFVTNETCGLHLNLSERILFEKGRQADYYCHILTSFDEAGILKMFNRLDNKYCRQFITEGRDFDSVKHQYTLLKRREKAAQDRGDEKWKANEGKYLTVSLRGAPTHDNYDGPAEDNQRIEFRCVGNKDYHLRFDDLEYALNHMLKCARKAHQSML